MPWPKGKTRSPETKEKIRSMMLIKNPFKGKRHTKEALEKMSENAKKRKGDKNPNWRGGITKRKCPSCGGKATPYRNMCAKCWYESKEKSESISGKKNPMYGVRGKLHPAFKGKSKVRFQVRACFEMRQWISDVFHRDNFICQDCGKQGGDLEAHHIKPFFKILDDNKIKSIKEALDCVELWNLNNGVTLCRKCHIKTFRKDTVAPIE